MEILEKAKSSLKAAEQASQESLSDFGTVIRQYEKLLKQATKLTRLGDGYQRKMLLAYEEIERQKLVLQENERQLEIRNRFIRETFGRYLSDDVVTGLLEAPEGLALGGEKRTVTIMMTDLRGFSALADGLDPAEVVTLLNGYLEVMTGIIQKWAGTIDEFIGDAILGLFGAPLLRPDDHVRAAACALEMQLAIPGVNAMNKEKGLPAIEMGIGLHTGEVVVGNIGSKLRAKYGVVGRAVNFASRVESYTVGGQVLISRELREALGPLAIIGSEMQVHPKGMQPVTIYDLVGLSGDNGIRLEQKNVSREKMKTELPATFIVVEGKDARGDEHHATFVAVSEELLEAEVNSDIPLKPLSNLRFRLQAAPSTDVYAKVLAGEAGHGTFIIRFTSLPETAKNIIAAAR
ncbi:MAG: adenylate/guanylate cyclase domain-containing protein [Acidobacteria bacterium]|nr:adenylate/guanylate cyclase domain-containing protein [Acidobacteriota bacterium]